MKKKLKSLLKVCTAFACAISICTLTVRADDSSVDSLTKNEASRIIDRIILEYGRIQR